MCLLVLYVPRELPFISTHFFVLNLDDWFGVLSSKFILYMYIPLLYYDINPRSSIIFWLFSVDMYLSFGISQWNSVFCVSLSSVSEVFCGEVLETFVTLSATYQSNHQLLLRFFKMCFLKLLFLAWSRSFWLYSLHKSFPYIFVNIVSHF